MAGLVQTSAPATEPLTLAQAKAWPELAEAEDHWDDLITALITAAREKVESFCSRQLISATWRLTLDRFPATQIWLPRPPLQGITSVTYVDGAGTTQTWDSDSYDVDTDGEPGRLAPAYGKTWPVPRSEINAVKVTYTAGYGDDATDVPEILLLACRMLIEHWFDNRGVVGATAEMPWGVKSLLWSERVPALRNEPRE